MSIKLDNTKAYLKSYSQRLIKLLKRTLDDKKITYTGAAKNSLRQNIVEDSLDAFGIEIVGKDYLKTIEEGGKPPKLPQVSDIANWLIQKPVDLYGTLSLRKIASRVTLKIRRVGINKNVFIKPLVDRERGNLKLIAPFVKDLEVSIKDIIKQQGLDVSNKTVKFK